MKQIKDILYLLIAILCLTACTDDITINESEIEAEQFNGEKVMLSAGSAENSVSTRADGKIYYMPADYRFVAKMYFITNESGAVYDTLRYHTAWLKVDDRGAGNSLYRKSTYVEPDYTDKDIYNNDEYAPTFYWQNRKKHAFLAWTDLNNPTEGTGNTWLNYNAQLSSYAFHTGRKEWQWVEKTITVRGNDIPFANEQAVVNWYKDRVEDQAEFKKIAKEEVTPSGVEYYWWTDNLENFCKVVVGNDPGEDKGTDKKTSPCHLMYFFKKKLEYNFPEGTDMEHLNIRPISMEGKEFYYVIDENNNPVARKVVENDVTKYYQCTTNCHIMYDESLANDDDYTVYIFRRNLQNENVEVVEDYPALAFDLTKGDRTLMAKQPDILQALTIDKIPVSAVMEANRVHLVFKHQFAQVQVNLKNSADNSVQIREDQIKNVELLGVTEKGYVFTSLNPDGTIHAPTGFNSSSFKEVVATDFTDAQLRENPYGTTFEMFNRTLTDDDRNINKIVKSYECITFGRLQAIRITWQEDGYVDPDGKQVEGITHVATYRVPEKNDQNQALRLLEAGKKYIWNMELRRGTLAVIRTEIIPWEENQERYDADGFITTN